MRKFCANNLYIIMPVSKVGLFRFLLEGYDNLAIFTVIEPKRALLRVNFEEKNRKILEDAIKDINEIIELNIVDDLF